MMASTYKSIYTILLFVATAAISADEVIPSLEEWHCGMRSLDRKLSYQVAIDSCPQRMAPANECCLQHDHCYVGREYPGDYCDPLFCECMQEKVGYDSDEGCAEVATTACQFVETFGKKEFRDVFAKITSALEKHNNSLSMTIGELLGEEDEEDDAGDE